MGEEVSDVNMIINGSMQDALIIDPTYSLQFVEGSDITLSPEMEDNWRNIFISLQILKVITSLLFYKLSG
ncbi:MAG: hypothetical protein EA362_01840 [Saprospirales bacterium]|nr:MAG: hypothetical protein EA362_01840 [Saprospirales bacterium]